MFFWDEQQSEGAQSQNSHVSKGVENFLTEHVLETTLEHNSVSLFTAIFQHQFDLINAGPIFQLNMTAPFFY